MQMESRVPFEPGLNAGVFVRAIVVDDQVQGQIDRCFDVDELEKSNEFLMPVARQGS